MQKSVDNNNDQGGLDAPPAVSAAIHDSDYIFRFISHGKTDREAVVEQYIKSGAEGAAWLKGLIQPIFPADKPFTLLEFAAGYGRVSRHIASAIPNAKLVASDIHPDAVEFLGQELGVTAHQSSTSPEQFAVAHPFDVIFALSFFTHMPKSTWSRWLRVLLGSLTPGGCLIFTTHGVPGIKVMGQGQGRKLGWDASGFWFSPMSEQNDLDTAEYGSTATSFRFVMTEIEACGARLMRFEEAGAGYQDLYIVRAKSEDDDGPRWLFEDAITKPKLRVAEQPELPEPADCIFYHSMEVPGLGPVNGQWDLRGSEWDCLGGVPLKGRSVLEIGPASGYLTFWMEQEGAAVTSLDLDPNTSWDLVPFGSRDPEKIHAERADLVRRVNNAWWYTRAAFNAQAKCLYGAVYSLDEDAGLFDVVTINNVLLHIRDPLHAIELAAARTKEHLVITDVSERQFAAGRPDKVLQFIPSIAADGPIDGWWHVPSTLVEEFLRILGFASVETRHHREKFQDGNFWDFYTVVGSRTAKTAVP